MRRLRPLTVVLASYVIAITAGRVALVEAADEWIHDRQRAVLPAPAWPPDFAVVRIDEAAERVAGRWPWERDRQAALLDAIAAEGATVVLWDFLPSGATTPAADAAFAAAVRRARVVLPVRVAVQGGREDVAERLRGSLVQDVRASPAFALQAIGLPEPLFAEAALALGHTWVEGDADSRRRTHLPFLGVGDAGSLPSIALAGYAAAAGADVHAIRWSPARMELPDGRVLPLDEGKLLLDPLRSSDPPPGISAAELLEAGGSPRGRFAGRVVLVYGDLLGYDLVPTAIGPQTPGGLLNAYAYRALRNGTRARRLHVPRVLPFLLVPALLAAPWMASAGPRRPVITGAAVVAAWIVGSTAAVAATGVVSPVVSPALFLTAAAGLLALLASRGLQQRLEVAEARADAARAPRGELALVFTDVQGSTDLWEKVPEAMRAALAVHDAVLRGALRETGGYEVKTEGDAFMVAFPSTAQALDWCLRVQERLLDADWPAEILERFPEVREPGGRVLWRGLRVRMGIHTGTPEPRPDPLTGRMDYFGPPVNRAARVGGAAHGGQILLSASAWQAVKAALPGVDPPAVRPLGERQLKGLSAPEALTEVLPRPLAPRAASFTGDRPTAP